MREMLNMKVTVCDMLKTYHGTDIQEKQVQGGPDKVRTRASDVVVLIYGTEEGHDRLLDCI